jgi:hypothetical protein
MRAGLDAFRRAYLSTDTIRTSSVAGSGGFGSHGARLSRYAAFWAAYENTLYDDTASLLRYQATGSPRGFKAEMGLYPFTRGILNPAFKLVEFHVSHVLGGELDPNAGDGSDVPTCLPILDASDATRAALARLWRDSNFHSLKDTIVRETVAKGDGFLTAIDLAGRIYLQRVDVSEVVEQTKDARGNVKAYVIERYRDDPLAPRRSVRDLSNPDVPQALYTETCERVDGGVLYRTYRDRVPHAWDGQPVEWVAPYPFVPLWHIEHIPSGTGWGWPEMFAVLPKICESDEQASKLSDGIRKAVETTWLLAGVSEPDATSGLASLKTSLIATRETEPSRARDSSMTIYARDAAAKPHALVTPLDIAGITDNLRFLVEQHAGDFPELRYELIRASGDANAKALREARKPAESKVRQRRVQYDIALTRAFQGCLAIGGWRASQGPMTPDLAAYAGFGFESFDRGDLDLRIGTRPVFGTTPEDKAESDTTIAGQVRAWVDAGVPLDLALRRAGWDEADIATVVERESERQAESDARLDRMAERVPDVTA